MTKQVLITGATGYIGSRLVKQLLDVGLQVHTLVRASSAVQQLPQPIQTHIYDAHYSSIDKVFVNNHIDAVFHLATINGYEIKGDDIAAMFQANLTLGGQLLHAMNAHGCKKLINTGSFWQHYHNETYEPICLYAATKQAFESIIDYYAQLESLSAITLKLMDVYGPSDFRNKLIPQLFKATDASNPLAMSPGEQQMDLIHVDDVCRAFSQAYNNLEQQPASHQRYFAATKQLHTLRQLVKKIEAITGKTLAINWGALPYRDNGIMHPYSGECLPNWQASLTLDVGLTGISETL